MPASYDVAAVGNALVDVIAPAADAFLERLALSKGAMMLVDDARSGEIYEQMAPGVETSGGSAANTVAGLASLGGQAAFVGKVAEDGLGKVFRHDITALGAHFSGAPMTGGPGTGRCMVNVTPDGQRTMCTYLGAADRLTVEDIDPQVIRAAHIVYLEGYLFDPPPARQAFAKAARIARDAGRKIAITLSDAFVVERHREALLAFLETEIDIVFANEAEATALFQTHDFDTAATLLGAKVATACVTRGEKGSVIITNGAREVVPAAPVKAVVDTTGAGDQYAAGALFGLARGLSPAVCGRLGALAASEVIGHYGPRPQTSLKALASQAGLI
jgi:sugar/nucleoside kinase (ribokinase family)